MFKKIFPFIGILAVISCSNAIADENNTCPSAATLTAAFSNQPVNVNTNYQNYKVCNFWGKSYPQASTFTFHKAYVLHNPTPSSDLKHVWCNYNINNTTDIISFEMGSSSRIITSQSSWNQSMFGYDCSSGGMCSFTINPVQTNCNLSGELL